MVRAPKRFDPLMPGEVAMLPGWHLKQPRRIHDKIVSSLKVTIVLIIGAEKLNDLINQR